MKIFSGLFGLLLLVLALVFALSNRQSASISLWPFGIEIAAPLYLLSLGTLFLGVLLGATFAWFAVLPHRLEARRLRKELARLNEKVLGLQQTVLPPRPEASLRPQPRFRRRLWGPRL